MQIICTSLQTDNHASNSALSFYRLDALPAAQPTVSKHSRHGDDNNDDDVYPGAEYCHQRLGTGGRELVQRLFAKEPVDG